MHAVVFTLDIIVLVGYSSVLKVTCFRETELYRTTPSIKSSEHSFPNPMGVAECRVPVKWRELEIPE